MANQCLYASVRSSLFLYKLIHASLELGAGGGLTGLALAIAMCDGKAGGAGQGHINMTDMDAMLDLMITT